MDDGMKDEMMKDGISMDVVSLLEVRGSLQNVMRQHTTPGGKAPARITKKAIARYNKQCPDRVAFFEDAKAEIQGNERIWKVGEAREEETAKIRKLKGDNGKGNGHDSNVSTAAG
jgi:hypothetical protein